MVAWLERYAELVEYKETEGDCDVPQRQGALGKWVSEQRKRKKNGKLPVHQQQKLEELGFNFQIRDVTINVLESAHCKEVASLQSGITTLEDKVESHVPRI